MAKGKNGKLRGGLKLGVGDVVMKVNEKGEQIVEGKHSKTNSRTDKQIVARCRQNNVMAAYSSLKRHLVNLWGEKNPNELYQKFKHANGKTESYALPPSERQLCVVTNWQVSEGRLESVTNRETGCSRIRLQGLETIDENTTVGKLSKAIIAGMEWNEFDAIEFVVMYQQLDEEGMPYVESESDYLVLETESERKVRTCLGERGWQVENGYLGAKQDAMNACGYCWVHVGDGEVSSEWMYCKGMEEIQREWQQEEKWVTAREAYRKRDDSDSKAKGEGRGAISGVSKEEIKEAVRDGVLEALRTYFGEK